MEWPSGCATAVVPRTANSHLKRIFLPGPESVGWAAFTFTPWLAGWLGANCAPPKGRRVSHVAFFRCHSSFCDAIWRWTVSATDSWPNQRFNLFFRDFWASHGCLVWFWVVETLIQSRICDFFSYTLSVDILLRCLTILLSPIHPH